MVRAAADFFPLDFIVCRFVCPAVEIFVFIWRCEVLLVFVLLSWSLPTVVRCCAVAVRRIHDDSRPDNSESNSRSLARFLYSFFLYAHVRLHAKVPIRLYGPRRGPQHKEHQVQPLPEAQGRQRQAPAATQVRREVPSSFMLPPLPGTFWIRLSEEGFSRRD